MIKAALNEKNEIVLVFDLEKMMTMTYEPTYPITTNFVLSQEEANRLSFELEVCAQEQDNAARGLCPACKGTGEDQVYEGYSCKHCNGRGRR